MEEEALTDPLFRRRRKGQGQDSTIIMKPHSKVRDHGSCLYPLYHLLCYQLKNPLNDPRTVVSPFKSLNLKLLLVNIHNHLILQQVVLDRKKKII